jgi:hypothetical protein
MLKAHRARSSALWLVGAAVFAMAPSVALAHGTDEPKPGVV